MPSGKSPRASSEIGFIESLLMSLHGVTPVLSTEFIGHGCVINRVRAFSYSTSHHIRIESASRLDVQSREQTIGPASGDSARLSDSLQSKPTEERIFPKFPQVYKPQFPEEHWRDRCCGSTSIHLNPLRVPRRGLAATVLRDRRLPLHPRRAHSERISRAEMVTSSWMLDLECVMN